MGICEDRITENSTEFEKEFLKIYDGNLWTALEKMKDWQPPKQLVEVPQFVADYIETQKDNNYNGNAYLIVKHYDSFKDEGNDSELDIWIANNFNDFLNAIVNGYTVKKEQLFCLKNKNTGHFLYRQPKESGGNLIEVVATINEEHTWFTQDEIDTMHTDSYEKIKVEP